jgi:hypothetical protein
MRRLCMAAGVSFDLRTVRKRERIRIYLVARPEPRAVNGDFLVPCLPPFHPMRVSQVASDIGQPKKWNIFF